MNFSALYSLTLNETKSAFKSSIVMILCLALGVMSMTAIKTISDSFRLTLKSEGRVILGGDLALTLVGREATKEELATIASYGQISKQITLRAMVRRDEKIALTELKAVDASYPLYGEAKGGEAETALLLKLQAKIGDQLNLGDTKIKVTGALINEPDKFSAGLGLSPRLLIKMEQLEAANLIKTGTLYRVSYKIKSDKDLSPLMKAFEKTDFEVRTFQNASPQIENQLNRFTEILTLTGLITLIIGALGISHAVHRRIEKSQKNIATLKALGASSRQLYLIFGLQLLVIATLAILLGVIMGTALPLLLGQFQENLLPTKIIITPSLSAMGLGASYGLAIAFIASLMPLDRLRLIPISAIYRDEITRSKSYTAIILTLIAVLALFALTYFNAHNRLVVLAFSGAMLIVLALILGLMLVVHKKKRSLIFALSLGLSLMTGLLWVEGTLNGQLQRLSNGQIPSFFFVDIPQNERDAFANLTKGKLVSVPNLRGRIVALNGVPSEQAVVAPSVKWVFQGDRGVTFASNPPEGAVITKGQWWGETNEALVSMEERIANDLGLKIGDTITVSVLGRQVSAKIANLRRVNWQSFGINFFMVFSPATFTGAPHSWLATLQQQETTLEEDEALLTKINQIYPSVTAVRVKDQIATINDLSSKIAFAIKAISGVTLLVALLVLAGAVSATNALRVKEVTLYKVLGATRGVILMKNAKEFAQIGLIACLFAFVAGGIITGIVSYYLLKMPPILDLKAALFMMLFSLICTLFLGLIATFKALSQKPSEVLRSI